MHGIDEHDSRPSSLLAAASISRKTFDRKVKIVRENDAELKHSR